MKVRVRLRNERLLNDQSEKCNRPHLSFFTLWLLREYFVIGCAALLAASIFGCAAKPPARPQPTFQQVGMASYYASKFHGRRTASGERYNQNAMTAAHLHLPFGTVVMVKNLKNHRSIQVRINDRGPYVKGRIIDVSYAAAKRLGMIEDGVVKVRIEIPP